MPPYYILELAKRLMSPIEQTGAMTISSLYGIKCPLAFRAGTKIAARLPLIERAGAAPRQLAGCRWIFIAQ
jgi:hypothetical protein